MKNIKHIKHIITSTLLLSSLLLGSCGSEDIALINEVKRFEPQWMNVSESAAFIQQKLSVTRRRYPKDLETIEPAIRKTGGADQTVIFGLRSQYRKVMSERDQIEQRYDTASEKLEEVVREFNTWETDLMKKKLKLSEARKEFEAYQKSQLDIQQQISDIESDLIRNIQEHNTILRQMVQILDLYNNFDISIR